MNVNVFMSTVNKPEECLFSLSGERALLVHLRGAGVMLLHGSALSACSGLADCRPGRSVNLAVTSSD